MKKGLEIRLYPTKEQRVLIDRTLGCSRFVYNHVLALKKELWEDYKLSFNPNLKSFKEEWKFLTKVPSQALANSYMDCLQAYNKISLANGSFINASIFCNEAYMFFL